MYLLIIISFSVFRHLLKKAELLGYVSQQVSLYHVATVFLNFYGFVLKVFTSWLSFVHQFRSTFPIFVLFGVRVIRLGIVLCYIRNRNMRMQPFFPLHFFPPTFLFTLNQLFFSVPFLLFQPFFSSIFRLPTFHPFHPFHFLPNFHSFSSLFSFLLYSIIVNFY